MIRALITLAFAVPLASSQSVAVIQPVTPGSSPVTPSAQQMRAAHPLLGYVSDAAGVLRTVVGSLASPLWGSALSLPQATTLAFLPPRQEYVLLVSESGLSIARLTPRAVGPTALVPNAMAHPAKVAFSPSGEAAALFSAAESRIEVMTYLAGEGKVLRSVPLANPSELRQFTLSDDGQLLVAAFANLPPAFSWRGAPWQSLSTNYLPDAWTFLPRSHDLVLSDRTRKSIVLLPEAEQAPIAAHLVADGIDANLLSASKQGSLLFAAATGTAASWSIDLISGSIASLPARSSIDSLTVLRDGQTFLVSATGMPVVLSLSNNSAHSTPQSVR